MGFLPWSMPLSLSHPQRETNFAHPTLSPPTNKPMTTYLSEHMWWLVFMAAQPTLKGAASPFLGRAELCSQASGLLVLRCHAVLGSSSPMQGVVFRHRNRAYPTMRECLLQQSTHHKDGAWWNHSLDHSLLVAPSSSHPVCSGPPPGGPSGPLNRSLKRTATPPPPPAFFQQDHLVCLSMTTGTCQNTGAFAGSSKTKKDSFPALCVALHHIPITSAHPDDPLQSAHSTPSPRFLD